MLKIGFRPTRSVPELCPVCLGSGLNRGMSGGPRFVPLWMGNRTEHNARCGKCDGKGWLPDTSEASPAIELESQIVHEILREHISGLNIDEISNLSKLDILTVYRVLQVLRDAGVVKVKSGSPVIYYAGSSNG